MVVSGPLDGPTLWKEPPPPYPLSLYGRFGEEMEGMNLCIPARNGAIIASDVLPLALSPHRRLYSCTRTDNFWRLIDFSFRDLAANCSVTVAVKDKRKRYSYPIIGLDRPLGIQEVEASRFQHIRRTKIVSSAPRIGPFYTPGMNTRKYSWYSFLSEAESTQGP
jgi:hypothetical protein